MATSPTVHAQGPTPDGDVTGAAGATSSHTGTPRHDADIQAARQALAERDAEIRTLTARQDASIEVLHAIAASPDDPQPVFELIVRRARELCNAQAASLDEYDGTLMHQRAIDGFEPEAAARRCALFPRPPGPETIPGRVVQSTQTVHISDARSAQGIFLPGHGLGARSILSVPLLRDGRVIGVLGLGRYDPGNFDQSAIELVQSFAAQAVIAISGAATLRELRGRTAELARRNSEYREQAEYQAATIDVLQVMSASASDTQPVFEIILRRAMSLSGCMPELCTNLTASKCICARPKASCQMCSRHLHADIPGFRRASILPNARCWTGGSIMLRTSTPCCPTGRKSRRTSVTSRFSRFRCCATVPRLASSC